MRVKCCNKIYQNGCGHVTVGESGTLSLSKNKAMINKNRQQILTQAALNHRESLRQNLQHRLELARNQNNEQLVRQLEQEAAYLHLK